MARILAFSGSIRSGSFNKMLLAVAVKGAREAGGQVTEIDLRDLPMPIYDGDLEAAHGLPENVRAFKALLADHQGLLIAAAEYNSSVTPLLKNAIDWASRAAPGEAPLASFRGRHAGLVCASPGALGGLRALYHLREILQNIGVSVLPDPHLVAVSKAHEAFGQDGSLVHVKQRESVEGVGKKLVEALR